MLNVASRAQTGTGANAHMAGFVVTGPKPNQILVRAVGPALANFDVAGVFTDPALAVFNAAGQQMFATTTGAPPTVSQIYALRRRQSGLSL